MASARRIVERSPSSRGHNPARLDLAASLTRATIVRRVAAREFCLAHPSKDFVDAVVGGH